MKSFKGLVCGVLALVLLLISGCAAPPPKKEEAVYFPPAPELPRIQYLTFFTGRKNIEEQSAFDRFVVGEKEEKRLDKPYGVGIYDGKIYVCDTNDTIIVIDLKQKTYQPMKGVRGAGKLIEPQNISIDADGIKYVSDPVGARVVAYDRNDEYLKAYIVTGAKKWKPVDAVPFGDRLYVADAANNMVRVFDKRSGELVRNIGDKGERIERLSLPTNVAADSKGSIYITDIGRMQVVKFDRDGHYLMAFGKAGANLGHFARPRGLALDREDHLYVADAAFNNIQIFDKNGRFLLFFGEGGQERGNFLLPAKVVVDYDNLEYFRKYVEPNFEPEQLILVTSQFGPRMVNVFALGKEKGKKYPTDEELLRQIEDMKKKALDEELKKEKKEGEGEGKKD